MNTPANIRQAEFTLTSLSGRDFLCDIRYVPDGYKKPVLLFVHGFKGFKDWGCFNLMADKFASNDFVVVKMNFSHNGTTPENPLDFVDLEAFGQNNFTKELDDMDLVTDFILQKQSFVPSGEIDPGEFYLAGHSRGGAVAILRAAEDDRIKKLVTFAALNNFSRRWPQSYLEEWKENGVVHILNGRTQQNMPLYYQIVEDFLNNRNRFDVQTRFSTLKIPVLLAHGSEDETLDYSMAYDLGSRNKNAKIFLMEGANHVFGGSHPYHDQELPEHFDLLVNKTIEFLKN